MTVTTPENTDAVAECVFPKIENFMHQITSNLRKDDALKSSIGLSVEL